MSVAQQDTAVGSTGADAGTSPVVLEAADWAGRSAAHRARARDLTAAARARRERGEAHPVEDFLYEYYSLRPGRLERWEPGVGVALARPGDEAPAPVREEWDRRAAARWHTRTVVGAVGADGSASAPEATPEAATEAVVLDAAVYLVDRRAGVEAMDRILRAMAGREAALGCLGLHEWAMVYRQEHHRHPLPLRLGQAGTDAVVDASTIRCTHHDAYRFFTPAAAPLNRLTPTRESQAAMEQPGCLHANMDLLRWGLKLGPAVPGDVLLDAFELARDIRVLDMEASPYDCRGLGYGVVDIETAQGRARYIERQRAFAHRAAPLRARLVEVTGALLRR